MRRSIRESEGRVVHAANVKRVANGADPTRFDGADFQNDGTRKASWVPVTAMVVVICGLAAAGYGYYSRERTATWTANQAELKAIAVMKVDSVTAWRNERLQDARLGASGEVDKDEILAEFYAQRWLLLASFVFAILLAASIGHMVHRAWNRRLREDLRRAERERWKLGEEARATFLSSVMNAVADPVFVKDEHRRFVLVNDALCAIVGRPREVLLGEDGDDMFPAEQVVVFRTGDVKVLENGLDNENEEDLSNLATGEVRTIVARKTRFIDHAGKRFIVGAIRDISDGKRVARAMEASEKRYRRLFEAARDGILILDADTGKIVDVNPFLVELTGFSKDDFLSKYLWEIGLFKDIVASRESFVELQAQEYIRYEDLPLRARDGRKIDVEFVSNVYLIDDHKVIQCNIRDVTARKQAESELRQSEQRFRVLFEQAADCILLLGVTPDGMPFIQDANHAVFKLLGYSRDELMGQPLTFLDAEPDASTPTRERRERIGTDTAAIIEVTHRCKDGTKRDFECSVRQIQIGSKTFGISVERDVTERKRMEAERQKLEEQLRVSQKMESIGTLASGVAHEINNPLNVIMNYGQLILDGTADAAQVKDYAGNIVKESDRVAVIVRNLLGFARRETATHSSARIVDIVEKTLSLVRAVLRKDQISVECEIPEGLPDIPCRTQQIQQVLMNLLTNARDALNQRYPKASDDKTIRIGASSFLTDGIRWVRLTVADHGGGIPPDVAGKVFDPFFTTKSRDKGTGLGLAISYGIMKEHHGNIWFESEPGSGAKFHVDLKAADDVPVLVPPLPAESMGA